MDKGFTLKVIEVGATVTSSTSAINYNYRGITEPNHACAEPERLKSGDVVVVQSVAPNKDDLIKGPCGCNFLLYERVTKA